VATLPDGRFILLDPLNRRISVYSSSGSFVETWPVPHFHVTLGGASRMRVNSTGTIAITFNYPGPVSLRTQAVARLRFGGAIIDTIPAPNLPDPRRTITKTSVRNGTRTHAVFIAPFSPLSQWEWSPLGYLATVITSRYAIDLRIPRDQSASASWRERDPVISIRAGFPAVPVDRRERADRHAYLSGLLSRIPGEQEGTLTDVPRTKPFVRWLRIADDGRLWVAVHAPSERYTGQPGTRHRDEAAAVGWNEPSVFDVFEPSGVYIGRTRLPFDFVPLTFRGDNVWGVTIGEFDVPYVKRYRIPWK
jgi:hypothetical protein